MSKEVDFVAHSVKARVKWFDSVKGFGMLESEGYPDVFVHYTEIQSEDEYRTLAKNDIVVVDVARSTKGLLALNVVKQPNP